MKHGWFYLGATLIVLGLVGVFIRKHHISTPKQFSDRQTTALNISPQVIKIGEQETSLAKQEIFQFDSWDAQNSLLHLRNQQGNSEQITLDPVKMQIMIPLKNASRLTAMKVLHEQNIGDLHWQTAFCPGDEVVASYEQGRWVLDNPET